MFSVLFTFMREDDSVHVITQFHGFTGRLSKGFWSNVGSLLSQQHERQGRHHITFSRQCLQDYTTITLSSLLTIPLTCRKWRKALFIITLQMEVGGSGKKGTQPKNYNSVFLMFAFFLQLKSYNKCF